MKPIIPTLLALLTLTGAGFAQEAAEANAAPGTAQSLPLTQTISDIITDPPDAATAEAAAGALTDPAAPEFQSPGEQLGFTTGEGIFQNLCRGCHQYDGAGASGAGAYPALAGNEKLEFADYPVTVVVNGQKAMPPLGAMLSDEQVVAVVTYIQTSFGNAYTEHPTLETVASARPETQGTTGDATGGN